MILYRSNQNHSGMTTGRIPVSCWMHLSTMTDEAVVSKTPSAIKIGQSRLAMFLVAVDAACWGALLFFGIHYFTS